jgi:hypothetical protein
MSISIVDMVANSLPKVKHLFMYRDCLASLNSMERTFGGNMNILFEYWKKFLNTKFGQFVCDNAFGKMFPSGSLMMDEFDDRYRPATTMSYMVSFPYGFWVMMWTTAVAEYLRLRKSGVDIQAIRYEDLLSSTERTIKSLSSYTGIKLDAKYIKENVMKQDSQRGTVLSQDKNKTSKKVVLDEKSEAELRFLCKKFGLPDLDPENVTFLEGTMQ